MEFDRSMTEPAFATDQRHERASVCVWQRRQADEVEDSRPDVDVAGARIDDGAVQPKREAENEGDLGFLAIDLACMPLEAALAKR